MKKLYTYKAIITDRNQLDHLIQKFSCHYKIRNLSMSCGTFKFFASQEIMVTSIMPNFSDGFISQYTGIPIHINPDISTFLIEIQYEKKGND